VDKPQVIAIIRVSKDNQDKAEQSICLFQFIHTKKYLSTDVRERFALLDLSFLDLSQDQQTTYTQSSKHPAAEVIRGQVFLRSRA